MAKYRESAKTRKALEQGLRMAIESVAIDVQNQARELLSQPGTGQKGPQARRSAPGEPPATQTGRLRNSVQVDASELVGRTPKARTGTGLDYGRYLEYGTRHIEPRPWLSKAWRKTKKRVDVLARRAMEKAMGRADR